MWYLIIWISGAYAPSIAIIPEKYPTEEACHAAAKSDRWSHSCIPAPVNANKNYIDNMPKCSVNPTTGKLECN